MSADLDLLRRILRHFAEEGGPPSGCDPDALRRLDEDRRLVLGGRGRIRMAHPFSGVATDTRVHSGNRAWYANCPWDGLGVLAATGADGVVESHCPDCGEDCGFVVTGGELEECRCVVHFVVPAARWWDDIVFT